MPADIPADISHDQRYRLADRIMEGVILYICLAGQCGAAADL